MLRLLTDHTKHAQVQQERISNLTAQIQDLEGKCTSLQLTIDRLSNALAKTEEGESHLKDKVRTLNFCPKWCFRFKLIL